MILIVGSAAMKDNGIQPQVVGNKKRGLDIDIIAHIQDVKPFVASYARNFKTKVRKFEVLDNGNKIAVFFDDMIFDIELAHAGSNQAMLLDVLAEQPHIIKSGQQSFGQQVADINLLYMLKMSHRFKKNTPFFLKTMRDIHDLRRAGAQFIPELQEWYVRREQETYTYKHPKLNTSKSEFFNANESFYVYDHDSLHEAVKHLERPAYEYYKPDTSEVNCSKDMFFAVNEQVRLYGVLEESYVLALERSLIPNNFQIPAKRAFNMALEKVCTSITSGWFREFAWENYYAVQNLYSDEFVIKFKSALVNGIVKPFTGNKY